MCAWIIQSTIMLCRRDLIINSAHKNPQSTIFYWDIIHSTWSKMNRYSMFADSRPEYIYAKPIVWNWWIQLIKWLVTNKKTHLRVNIEKLTYIHTISRIFFVSACSILYQHEWPQPLPHKCREQFWGVNW